ncbi:MAG: MFS transporter [Anaerolineaceae bacterium]|nr:MFS transporter [Anaerolineaceae bacterium]
MTETLSPEVAQEPSVVRKNFRNVQIDAIAIGLTNAAAPFLPVFLSRLNATTLEISLLTTMPGITGLLMVLPLGQFLQTRKNIIPWFSTARLLYILSYALTGLAVYMYRDRTLILAILIIWALATLPQTLLNITFPMVMNAVAGPNRRYELMARRWSILGVSTSITVLIIGQVLERIRFPNNYQAIFLGLSVGGVISFFLSRQISLSETRSPEIPKSEPLIQRMASIFRLVRGQKAFVSFISRRFVFLIGFSMTLPLFPIYYVREVHAPDNWIAIFNTIQTSIVVIGYLFWSRQSRRRGARFILTLTTGVLSFYPILTAFTHDLWIIALYAGIAGIFQGGIDLVFFDELMKTIPLELSATFVSIAQGAQYLSTIFAPLLGTLIADSFGVGGGLILGGLFRFAGFLLFLLKKA